MRTTQNQLTDPSGTIVFDTSSGISLEEQQEILAGINAITGSTHIIPDAVVTKARKNGFIFPLFVNIGAVIVLGLGFYMLSQIHVQDEQTIRDNSSSLGITERKLIQELRQETNPAIEELKSLGDERERAARIEGFLGGFFARVNNQIEAGQLNEASTTLLEMREFLNSPTVRGIRSLEAGVQSHMMAVDSLEKAVYEAIRLRDEASLAGSLALGEALTELQARYAQIEQDLVAADQSNVIAEKNTRITQLETANASQQETLNRRDNEIVSLKSDLTKTTEANTVLSRKIDSVPSVTERIITDSGIRNFLSDEVIRNFISEIERSVQ